jgi:UDP-glucose 4-epimerase
MTEIMLRDAGAAHGLRYMILRYFNVAGAASLGRTGQSTKFSISLARLHQYTTSSTQCKPRRLVCTARSTCWVSLSG